MASAFRNTLKSLFLDWINASSTTPA